ncbi:MAG TPA: DUF488 domain-containing protein [Candidatus Acidoferrum sp.]|nr:DUF488 domain-containing protein [Candidatus Acidoferrum sp.]
MNHRLFTIGHSAMEFAVFLKLLEQFEIKLVIDVRSRPRSQRFPQFDQIELEGTLRAADIRYLFLGEELGGRPEDPKGYRSDGLVDYRARRKSRTFASGIERVLGELERDDLVLLCAEEDPLNCHRFLMICPELAAMRIEPVHIRKGGIRETQREAEDRLLHAQKMAAVADASLFPEDREAALESAYVAQSEKYAFRIDPRELDIW